MGIAPSTDLQAMTSEPQANPPGFRDVRMRGFQDRSEVTNVCALLDARLQPLAPEPVRLQEAAGRVLAADVVAEVAVPGFDRAAMDGYALHGSETFGADPYNPLEFSVVGQALPGKPYLGTVGAGQAVRIMTGAPLPAGADAVLQAEAAEETGGRLKVSEAVPPGRHVGRRGEDLSPGNIVLPAGRLLRPQDVGVLASVGAATVPVVRRPRVAVLITGDELLPCGSRPEGYRIVDSNSVMLEALVRRDGGLPAAGPLIPDQREAVRAALLGAAADVLLISGGSSVGQEDHAPRILADVGELCVHGVALRPASPAGVGFLRAAVVFLLPGNPVSCLCAYDLFAGRAVRRLGGRGVELPYRSSCLPLARKIASAVGRVDYVRVLVRNGQVEPIATSGASILSSTTRADGFVLVPRDSEGHAPCESVQVFWYD
jgi:molybdopterin molybdotransferase